MSKEGDNSRGFVRQTADNRDWTNKRYGMVFRLRPDGTVENAFRRTDESSQGVECKDRSVKKVVSLPTIIEEIDKFQGELRRAATFPGTTVNNDKENSTVLESVPPKYENRNVKVDGIWFDVKGLITEEFPRKSGLRRAASFPSLFVDRSYKWVDSKKDLLRGVCRRSLNLSSGFLSKGKVVEGEQASDFSLGEMFKSGRRLGDANRGGIPMSRVGANNQEGEGILSKLRRRMSMSNLRLRYIEKDEQRSPSDIFKGVRDLLANNTEGTSSTDVLLYEMVIMNRQMKRIHEMQMDGLMREKVFRDMNVSRFMELADAMSIGEELMDMDELMKKSKEIIKMDKPSDMVEMINVCKHIMKMSESTYKKVDINDSEKFGISVKSTNSEEKESEEKKEDMDKLIAMVGQMNFDGSQRSINDNIINLKNMIKLMDMLEPMEVADSLRRPLEDIMMSRDTDDQEGAERFRADFNDCFTIVYDYNRYYDKGRGAPKNPEIRKLGDFKQDVMEGLKWVGKSGSSEEEKSFKEAYHEMMSPNASYRKAKENHFRRRKTV